MTAQEEVFAMSVVTLIGAGQMASALTFPLFENGHEVRLVGSPLDDEIIDRLNQNEVELEEAITLFEEGLKLVKQCDARLKQFEKRVSVLSEVKEEGEGDA